MIHKLQFGTRAYHLRINSDIVVNMVKLSIIMWFQLEHDTLKL